jgi:hypothetical protein
MMTKPLRIYHLELLPTTPTPTSRSFLPPTPLSNLEPPQQDMTGPNAALEKSFGSCSFAPTASGKITVTANIKVDDDTNNDDSKQLPSVIFRMTSFFIDSSGRSTFSLPLELKFSSKQKLDEFLAAGCLDPPPQNLVQDDDTRSDMAPSRLAFEVKSSPMEESKEVSVEGVTIQSCSVDADSLAIHFQLKVTVRAVLIDDDVLSSPLSPVAFSASPRGSGSVGGAENFNFIIDQEEEHDVTPDSTLPTKALNVVASLQIIPVLSILKHHSKNSHSMNSDDDDTDLVELMALEMAAIPYKLLKTTMDKVQEVRLSPMLLTLTLTHAFTISVKSVPGPNSPMGSTLVSLTMQHSNSHSETVTVTNIALHPGHSRQDFQDGQEPQQSVINMTKAVQWGYLPCTELRLPLSIGPHEAYSTILYVDAGEEMLSRAFVSPLSVTGYVGNDTEGSIAGANDATYRVVVAGDAHWTTKLVAVEPADAFRIHMNVERNITKLGEPFVVKLRIFNLSLDSRDLMLLFAKSEAKASTIKADAFKEESVNSAVVSEADGYTFGVWGISEDDDGTVQLNRDYELLAIDAALVLGEVEGQHAVDASLRLAPLKLGRLKVPNWKLYDKFTGKWYHCVHNLSIVAVEN